jgi:hypothetical protein
LGDEVYLNIGFLHHPECFRPQAHAYWRIRLPWIAVSDGRPHIDGYSRPRDPAMGNPAER